MQQAMMEGILALFFGGSNDEADGLALLQSVLAEREANLRLTAEYGRPTINSQGEITAVFPITLYHEGEQYGAHAKEFTIPDGGLGDGDSPLARFLAAHDIESVDALGDIEGDTAPATLLDNGDVEVER